MIMDLEFSVNCLGFVMVQGSWLIV